MTEVLHSPSHFPSSPSSLSCASTPNDDQPETLITNNNNNNNNNPISSSPVEEEEEEEEEEEVGEEGKDCDKEGDQLSLLALLITVFRKSLVSCKTLREEKLCSMEIGWPTNVRHVAHVTFDRFNGFLGLPVEFEPEVSRRAPSASASVFGVSTESMQLSYDIRGNSVPTILLLMQRRLYAQGGLQAEGIFRINAENSQEEYVRDHLNRGIVPDGIDVHCLAGLIKAWFRELPSGVLDPLEPEQVMQSQTEEQCAQLVRLLPPTESALLDWAINLMADVVQEEHHNKMNSRNIAMVFAPNMTQMADPLTALMYAVQVMNFLKTLINRTLKEREDTVIDSAPASNLEPSDENGHNSSSQTCVEEAFQEEEETDRVFVANEPALESPHHSTKADSTAESGVHDQTSAEMVIPDVTLSKNCSSENLAETDSLLNGTELNVVNRPKPASLPNAVKSNGTQRNNSDLRKGSRKTCGPPVIQAPRQTEKSRGISIISRINSRTERVEAWR